MKRSTFFKSLAVLFGVAVTKPLELFGEKKEKTFVYTERKDWSINYGKGTEGTYEGILPTIKKYGHRKYKYPSNIGITMDDIKDFAIQMEKKGEVIEFY